MNRYLVFLCIVAFSVGCKGKKKVDLSGKEHVEVTDFLEGFPDVDLPFVIADTTLSGKPKDSSSIAYDVYTNFIPDSVLKKDFGKTSPKLYALGKVREKGKETYLFVKAVQGSKRTGYLVCFDDNNKYLRSMPLIKGGLESYSSAYGSLDKKFQITTYVEKKNAAGGKTYKKNVYIYNSASNDFTLILTEPNTEMIEEIINPIDTLSQKNKYTGDYPSNKKNFISFRDGKKPSEIIFFIHFEKDKGACVGELKGTARFVSAKTAIYKENGNPCTLEFNFTPSAVVMKEVEGCGSYRDIKCFFDATFPKKKKKTLKSGK